MEEICKNTRFSPNCTTKLLGDIVFQLKVIRIILILLLSSLYADILTGLKAFRLLPIKLFAHVHSLQRLLCCNRFEGMKEYGTCWEAALSSR